MSRLGVNQRLETHRQNMREHIHIFHKKCAQCGKGFHISKKKGILHMEGHIFYGKEGKYNIFCDMQCLLNFY